MNKFPPEHSATIIQLRRMAPQCEVLARVDWDLLFHTVADRLAALAAEPDAERLRSAVLECAADLRHLHTLRTDAVVRRDRLERVFSDLRSAPPWVLPPMPRAPFALEPA